MYGFFEVLCVLAVTATTVAQECEDFGQHGPHPMTMPANQTAKVGQKVTFKCKANFGCGDSFSRMVFWDTADDPRYEKQTSVSENGAMLGSTLTINGVRTKDFARDFTCRMLSARRLNPRRHFTVYLAPAEIPISPWRRLAHRFLSETFGTSGEA